MPKFYILLLLFFSNAVIGAQCPTCGNGIIDAGETNANCPQDVPKGPTCATPCGQPTAFESAAGVRLAFDFVGTTTYGGASLPTGWTFAGAPSATTAGSLPVADGYGAKAGLVQPNCSGSCTSTNGFCIGNLASSSASGKLGANFDGRTNVTQNPSYAVLRGQGNPTLVSPTVDFSGVEGFKIQLWMFPSETSCGQSNAWGSCVGNLAFIDFSSDGGSTWQQIVTLSIASTNTDMCGTANTNNTLWLKEGSWSRTCITVFKSSTSPGNFYSAATGTTAASGIMVNSAYFTANFKFRVRYSQTASCTSGITTTNPGRYLAIDYPVITSGNEMIPCGISFSKLCGYGEDNNDDGVGSSTLSTTATAFGTIKRSVREAERGVEIFPSQNASFAPQNLTGSAIPSNFDLCNAEGGDRQCIDWRNNNNSYFVVYECITDWEASGINVNYYRGGVARSFGLTKVTTSGRTALIGWRFAGSRFINCNPVSSSDLEPGCNGYLFQSTSLPTQFARGFYALAANNLGASWAYYGASTCSNYFNGPFVAPIAVPDTVTGSGNFTTCNASQQLVFTGLVDYCITSGFSGAATLAVSGPSGFSDVLNAGALGTVSVTTPGEYTIVASPPSSPTQCVDCSKSVCVQVTAADMAACIVLNEEILSFAAENQNGKIALAWQLDPEARPSQVVVERSSDGYNFSPLASFEVNPNAYLDAPIEDGHYYYRLKIEKADGSSFYSSIKAVEYVGPETWLYPNPASEQIQILNQMGGYAYILDLQGRAHLQVDIATALMPIDISMLPEGVYIVSLHKDNNRRQQRLIIKR